MVFENKEEQMEEAELFKDQKENLKEKSKFKVDAETANNEIDLIEEEFGSLTEEQKIIFKDSIQRGNLSFDSETSTLNYTLEKPVGTLKQIVFPEPSAGELQEISKGDNVNLDKKGDTKVNLKKMSIDRCILFLNKICNCKPNDINDIKKRDFGVLVSITDFLS